MGGYLRKKVSVSHTLIRTEHFPFHKSKLSCSCKSNIVLIGIGGNIGDVPRRFEHLYHRFQRSSLLKITDTSQIFKNPPFGYLDQPDFYNALILVCTKLSPLHLLTYLQSIEKEFGRKRLFKDSPRTLDLDILLYEKRRVRQIPRLIIPHPAWQDRESVQIPLETMKGVPCLKRVL